MVAEVLTTIRSPGARCRGKSKNRPCAIEPSARSVTRSRTPSRSNPRASGGSLASRRTAGLDCERAHPAETSMRSRARYEPAREVALDEREKSWNALLRWRPVRDVLAREGVLLHLRPHVARIDGVDAELRMLGGENGGHLCERCLRGAVPAPALVRFDRGVGAHVDDPRAIAQVREARAGRERAGRAR